MTNTDIRQTHTPGPWIAAHRTKFEGEWPAAGGIGPHIVGYGGDAFDWVATCQVSNTPEWRANARLIAAAPDLLAALDKLVDSTEALMGRCEDTTIPQEYPDDWLLLCSRYDEAQLAISRAKGEE